MNIKGDMHKAVVTFSANVLQISVAAQILGIPVIL